jgi:hypothetical protein
MKRSPTEYMLDLARSFPCLEPKLRWWDPANFDADIFHDMIGGWSSSERQAAHFVLTVWNPGYARDCGWTFDVVEAVSSLDPVNRAPIYRLRCPALLSLEPSCCLSAVDPGVSPDFSLLGDRKNLRFSP